MSKRISYWENSLRVLYHKAQDIVKYKQIHVKKVWNLQEKYTGGIEMKENGVASHQSATSNQELDAQTPKVSSIVNIKEVSQRITTFLDVLPSKDRLFDILNVVLEGISELSESEKNILIRHTYAELKGHKATVPMQKIDKYFSDFFGRGREWEGRTYIGEESNQMYIQGKTTKIYISNFTLTPKHIITVHGGERFHVYTADIKNMPDYHPPVMLRAKDFNTLDSLQKQVEKQLGNTSAFISNCSGNMGDLAHKHIVLAKFECEKQGTSLIGLERLEDDGPKFFCTPNGIYDLEGKKSEDIIYMGNEQSNQEELKNLVNLEYDPEEWKKTAKTFLKHILSINSKTSMMLFLGWMGAIPHDYVVRKECHVNGFPHFHVVGEPGAGKTTFMSLVKQFMGHNDSTPRTFPSPFELGKLLNSSYNIPVLLDEYGKRWDEERLNKTNIALVESYNKTRFSKGRADQSSVYYKYKNPIMLGGQIPIADQALASRTITIRMLKSFHGSKHGEQAQHSLRVLRNVKNKNFWTGYNIWAAKHDNKEVSKIYEMYNVHAHAHIKDSRVADIYTIVMLGLHFIFLLSKDLETSVGYDKDDIVELSKQVGSDDSLPGLSDVNLLQEFLKDLSRCAVSIGNNNIYGKNFGIGHTVMRLTPSKADSGQYGNKTKHPACIHGRDLILIKIDSASALLNQWQKKKSGYNDREIMTFIESEFQKSMQNPLNENNLVLAPKQYRTQWGFYTAFHKSVLESEFPEFANVKWDA